MARSKRIVVAEFKRQLFARFTANDYRWAVGVDGDRSGHHRPAGIWSWHTRRDLAVNALAQASRSGYSEQAIVPVREFTGRLDAQLVGAEPVGKHAFYISPATAQVIGLDDMARYPDIDRVEAHGRVMCIGELSALVSLLTEINDRATEDETGYNETPASKRACAATVRDLRSKGWAPHN